MQDRDFDTDSTLISMLYSQLGPKWLSAGDSSSIKNFSKM